MKKKTKIKKYIYLDLNLVEHLWNVVEWESVTEECEMGSQHYINIHQNH